jgi:hypothetical protein
MNQPANLIEALKAQEVALLDEKKALEDRITQLTKRLLALQDEAEQRRIEMSKAFRDQHAKRFPKLDVAKALGGYPAGHDATICGAVYLLRPPSQGHALAAEKFGAKPEPADLAPVTPNERILIAWLAGVGNGNEMRELQNLPERDRLLLIRRLPQPVLAKLADECASIETYLSISLELELGKY